MEILQPESSRSNKQDATPSDEVDNSLKVRWQDRLLRSRKTGVGQPRAILAVRKWVSLATQILGSRGTGHYPPIRKPRVGSRTARGARGVIKVSNLLAGAAREPRVELSFFLFRLRGEEASWKRPLFPSPVFPRRILGREEKGGYK